MKNSPSLFTAAASALLLSLVGHRLAAADALLTPGPVVTIPDSTGKFDFLEVDGARHRLLAAHEKDGTADFIDLNTNTLITRVKLGPAVHVAIDPKTGNYWISGSDEKKIYLVDGETLKPIGEIPMDGELDAIRYDPTNGRMYITNDEGTHVWGLDTASQKVVATIDIPSAPEYMIYDPTTDRFYLNLKKENAVAVIDPKTSKIVETWSTLPAENPHGLAWDPATKRLFPAGQNGVLSVIDTQSGKVIGSANYAKGVDQNVFDPFTRRVYCACGSTMSVLQETDDGVKFLGNISVAPTAKNVAVDPNTHSVWTCYTDGKNSYAKSWTP